MTRRSLTSLGARLLLPDGRRAVSRYPETMDRYDRPVSRSRPCLRHEPNPTCFTHHSGFGGRVLRETGRRRLSAFASGLASVIKRSLPANSFRPWIPFNGCTTLPSPVESQIPGRFAADCEPLGQRTRNYKFGVPKQGSITPTTSTIRPGIGIDFRQIRSDKGCRTANRRGSTAGASCEWRRATMR